MGVDFGDGESGFTDVVIEFPFIADGIWKIEDIRANPFVEVFKPRDDVLDLIADAVVVSHEKWTRR